MPAEDKEMILSIIQRDLDANVDKLSTELTAALQQSLNKMAKIYNKPCIISYN
jgi:hypothetical protein